MNLRFFLLVVAGVLGTTALAFSTSVQPTASGPGLPDDDAPHYIGSDTCRKCHGDQHKSWKKTKMAAVFNVLKAGERAEQKTEAGLDPNKDYTRDETCLPCHTTGYGEPGGYAIPPEDDSVEAKKARKAAKAMQGVQCEACHGPGSKAVEFKTENEAYKWSDIEAKGLVSGMAFPTVETCKGCHNQESPFAGEDYEFDYVGRKEKGTHEHIVMDFDHACTHDHSVTKKKRRKKKR